MLERLKTFALVALSAALALLAYFHFLPASAPVGVHLEARRAAPIAATPTALLAVDQVRVYAPEAKARLKLSAAVQANPDQHVIASNTTPADDRSHTLTTVLDVSTGESATFDRAEPRPWLRPNTTSEVGVFVGYRNGEQALRLAAHQELLQVKAVHLGAIASADVTAGALDTFVGVGAWARW